MINSCRKLQLMSAMVKHNSGRLHGGRASYSGTLLSDQSGRFSSMRKTLETSGRSRKLLSRDKFLRAAQQYCNRLETSIQRYM